MKRELTGMTSRCIRREKYFVPKKDSIPDDNGKVEGVWRSRWTIDKEIPIFKGEGREYINNTFMDMTSEKSDSFNRTALDLRKM